MISTEGFFTGIDAPDVWSMTIFGCSRSIVEAWQAIGRVGRDGSDGFPTVLYHRTHLRLSRVKHDKGLQLLADFKEWAEGMEVCLPKRAKKYLGSENVPKSCIEIGGMK